MQLTGTQMALGAAAVVGAYALWTHERNKNVLDKASDSFEQTRFAARQHDPTRTGTDAAGDAAAKAYYDAKKGAQRT